MLVSPKADFVMASMFVHWLCLLCIILHIAKNLANYAMSLNNHLKETLVFKNYMY